jgi:hypothetical protein
MKEFTYSTWSELGIVMGQVAGAVSIIVWTLLGGFVIALGIMADPPTWTSGCLALWILIVGWASGLTLMNMCPTVWVGDQGLVISAFIVKRVAIPWDEIIDIRVKRIQFGLVLVRARHITPFHIIYGWLYSWTLRPGFIITAGMQNRDDLVREIRQRLGERCSA